MNTKNPLMILGIVVAVAIGVSILLSMPSDRKPPMADETVVDPRDEVAEETELPTVPQAQDEHGEEIELAATERMTTEEGRELIRTFRDKVSSASSATVRIEVELFQSVKPDPIVGEIRFDSRKPDRAILEIGSFQPVQKRDLEGDWEFQKIEGQVVSATKMRVIEYANHMVHDVLFDETNEAVSQYTDIYKGKAEKLVETPLQDILAKIPLEDRLREVIHTTLVRSSVGDTIQIVSRMPRDFVEEFKTGWLQKMYPHLIGSDFGNRVALRTDIFDAETKDWKETVFADVDKRDLLRVNYTEISLGESVPEDRFELEEPSPANYFVLNETLARGQTQHSGPVKIPARSMKDIMGATDTKSDE